MNMELTESIAKYEIDIYNDPKSLIKLKPSRIMQESGDVFDPDHFIIDSKSKLIFRKEQFVDDNNLSAEYVIRDKRYFAQEISDMAKKVGFAVLDCKFVQAGRWDSSLENIDRRAKEILLLLKKS